MEDLLSYFVCQVISPNYQIEVEPTKQECNFSSPYYVTIRDLKGCIAFLLNDADIANIRHLASILEYDEDLQRKVEKLNELVKSAGF